MSIPYSCLCFNALILSSFSLSNDFLEHKQHKALDNVVVVVFFLYADHSITEGGKELR